MEKEFKQNSFIMRQAENIIDDYTKNKKVKYDVYYYKEKYERLKILSIAISVVSAFGILFTVIFK